MVGRRSTKGVATDEPSDDATTEGQRTLYGFRAVYVFDISQTEGKELPTLTEVNGDVSGYRERLFKFDVALRRRFDFKELAVDLSVCKQLTGSMRSALQELNRRIVLRKDRDHQIGHAYFVSVADDASFNQRFRSQIIPLLQEYFYNDWEGLRYILAENSTAEGLFIRKVSGSEVKEARTKWQWFFDAGTDAMNCLEALCGNYQIV